MGACSTLSITRSKAKQIVIEKICGNMLDSELEQFVDTIIEHRLYNCRIVDDGDNNDDHEL